MKRKAFVLHLRSQDISELADKAEVQVVLNGKITPFFADALMEDIQKGMSHLVTQKDYIVPVGSSVACFLAGIMVGKRRPKRVNLLVHDASTGHYREVVLTGRSQ